MMANTRRAARTDATKYGVPGVVCSTCYPSVLYRVKHGLDPATGEKTPTPAKEATPR